MKASEARKIADLNSPEREKIQAELTETIEWIKKTAAQGLTSLQTQLFYYKNIEWFMENGYNVVEYTNNYVVISW